MASDPMSERSDEFHRPKFLGPGRRRAKVGDRRFDERGHLVLARAARMLKALSLGLGLVVSVVLLYRLRFGMPPSHGESVLMMAMGMSVTLAYLLRPETLFWKR